tara:strand:+ start:1547 stop:1753 length:207 start_codon:yes stop_codon:yes gene_type:complete
MEFNDLPLLLTAGEAVKITGLTYIRLNELEELGILECASVNRRKRRYTRESLRKFLRLGPEGTKVRVD